MIIKKQYSSYNKNLSVRTGIEQLESTSDISKVRFRKKRDFYRVTIYSFIYANWNAVLFEPLVASPTTISS